MCYSKEDLKSQMTRIMKRRGQEGEPFQLLIGMIVFGMALFIGYYLFDMVNCWKCNALLEIEAKDLGEMITTVGRGSINSRVPASVDIQNIGTCVQGIYLRHVETGSGFNCRQDCPAHPNSCWVVMARSNCGEQSPFTECININGDTIITPEEDFSLSTLSGQEDQWLEGSYFFSHTMYFRIEKKSENEIVIGKL